MRIVQLGTNTQRARNAELGEVEIERKIVHIVQLGMNTWAARNAELGKIAMETGQAIMYSCLEYTP